MTHILSQVLNKLPTLEDITQQDKELEDIDVQGNFNSSDNETNDELIQDLSNLMYQNKDDKKYIVEKSKIGQMNDIWEFVWKECGFTRGAVILQGISIKMDDNHCLKPYLNRFCITEFSKLAKYGLLEPANDNDKDADPRALTAKTSPKLLYS